MLGELEDGIALYPALGDVKGAGWLEEVPVDSLDELRLFAEYARVLVAGQHNVGESSVLAWAEAHGAIAVVDDQTAVNIAKGRGVRVRRTLSLIAAGIHNGVLDREEAQRLVDDLRSGGARFPCTGAEFIEWATEKGLL